MQRLVDLVPDRAIHSSTVIPRPFLQFFGWPHVPAARAARWPLAPCRYWGGDRSARRGHPVAIFVALRPLPQPKCCPKRFQSSDGLDQQFPQRPAFENNLAKDVEYLSAKRTYLRIGALCNIID